MSLEFGRDDSFRTTWAFAAEAAAQVWHGTRPAVVEAKSRPTFHLVSVHGKNCFIGQLSHHTMEGWQNLNRCYNSFLSMTISHLSRLSNISQPEFCIA